MTSEPINKRLAEKGFLFDGFRYVYESDERKIEQYLKSGQWKVPKRPKRLKLTDF